MYYVERMSSAVLYMSLLPHRVRRWRVHPWPCTTSVYVIVAPQGKKVEGTPLAMYNFFIERVKTNLHIVLAMSPIGDAFRNRLRMFPSLINCCTIDWFQVCKGLFIRALGWCHTMQCNTIKLDYPLKGKFVCSVCKV